MLDNVAKIKAIIGILNVFWLPSRGEEMSLKPGEKIPDNK